MSIDLHTFCLATPFMDLLFLVRNLYFLVHHVDVVKTVELVLLSLLSNFSNEYN